ncbi:MAG: AAA family ATPase [Burkholderiales bacterium]
MKIAVISPNPKSLEIIGRYLQADGSPHSVALVEGGMSKLRIVADQRRPDLIVVDSMCRDLDELSGLEQLGIAYPQTMVILLCANQTPEFLLNAMRAGVREVLPSPVTREALQAAIRRVEMKLGVGKKTRQPGKVLAFIPCKGGSGATFIATNLGYQLAAEGKKTLVIDLNLQFGDAVLFVHDHKSQSNLADVARNISRLDSSFLTASLVNVTPNFGVLAAPEDPGQAMEVKPEHIDVLLNLAANQYDFVILDIGRVLDAVTIKALDHAHQVFPVLQTTLPFIRDASRLLSVFRSLGYSKEKISLVVNRYDKSAEIKLEDVERSLGVSVFRTIPNHFEAVAASVNHGKPIMTIAKNNPVTKSLTDFAQGLLRQPGEANGWLGRLIGR